MNLNDFEKNNQELVDAHYLKHKADDRIQELESQLREARDHLKLMLEPKEEHCRYDHNRNCQEHGWFGLNGDDCPVSRARDYLNKYEVKNDNG